MDCDQVILNYSRTSPSFTPAGSDPCLSREKRSDKFCPRCRQDATAAYGAPSWVTRPPNPPHHPPTHPPNSGFPLVPLCFRVYISVQMIVADTGNNRLQVFHIEELAMPPDDPSVRVPSNRSSCGSASSDSRYRGLSSSSSLGDGSLDGMISSRGATPSSSLMAWARSQAPPPPITTTTTSSPGRRVEDGDECSRACLLVFNGGGEYFVGVKNRRTAGESEAAEGPLSQPCDVAYWRTRRRVQRRGLPEDDDTTEWAWAPEPPPWFRRHSGRSGGRLSSSPSSSPTSSSSSFSATDDEKAARRELLSSGFPPWDGGISAPSPGAQKNRSNEITRNTAAPVIHGGVVGGGEPPVGAFVVRETDVRGKLQLLFVAKTKVPRRVLTSFGRKGWTPLMCDME